MTSCVRPVKLANGNRYEGDFQDGKYNGKGVFTYANGYQQEGIWMDDKLVKPEKIQ